MLYKAALFTPFIGASAIINIIVIVHAMGFYFLMFLFANFTIPSYSVCSKNPFFIIYRIFLSKSDNSHQWRCPIRIASIFTNVLWLIFTECKQRWFGSQYLDIFLVFQQGWNVHCGQNICSMMNSAPLIASLGVSKKCGHSLWSSWYNYDVATYWMQLSDFRPWAACRSDHINTTC